MVNKKIFTGYKVKPMKPYFPNFLLFFMKISHHGHHHSLRSIRCHPLRPVCGGAATAPKSKKSPSPLDNHPFKVLSLPLDNTKLNTLNL
jgi:hypothetical protein